MYDGFFNPSSVLKQVILMVIFGIHHPVHNYNPEFRPHFPMKSRIPARLSNRSNPADHAGLIMFSR